MNVARARRAHGRPWVLLQRGAGGHGEPRGAGEVGGRLSSAAGGVHNARTQQLARSPGAGERPGEKKKNEQNTKTGATEGGQAGEGRLWRPEVLSSRVGKARGAPKISLTQSISHIPSNSKQGDGTSGEGGLTPVCHGHTFAFTFIPHSKCRGLSRGSTA